MVNDKFGEKIKREDAPKGLRRQKGRDEKINLSKRVKTEIIDKKMKRTLMT